MATKKTLKKNNSPKQAPPSIGLVGRVNEIIRIRACVRAGRNLLLEGPVGVGKTHLALAVTRELGLPVFRVDGDQRYTEQKLAGGFDPPLVLRKGYGWQSFVPGPLVEAMRSGGVLFINELNRLPEGVQNVLLPSIDERILEIPRLGRVEAKPGFQVIATQNPKEFVATSHLSEAILDRFELVTLDYQSEPEERAIVSQAIRVPSADNALIQAAVRLVRLTRGHPRVKRGASVRAAIAIAAIAHELGEKRFEEAFRIAVELALPTRIEIERDSESEHSHHEEVLNLIQEWVKAALAGESAEFVAKSEEQKKNF